MNLRDQLKELLPEILPANPQESIKGTELIRMVKFRLRQEYSDATLRYHFSILCCDPSSPIAKVDQGQGYYLRGNRMTFGEARYGFSSGMALPGVDMFQNGGEGADVLSSRLVKARAIFSRLAQTDHRFPFGFTQGQTGQAHWKFPDFALVDWEIQDAADQGFALSRDLLELKRSLGMQPFSVSSVKLVLSVHYDNVREIFFQALSTSRWAHAAELVIAGDAPDETLAEELRRLGMEYGVGVSTLGVNLEELDEMGDAAGIASMDEPAFEKLAEARLKRHKITSAQPGGALNWRLISEMRRDNPEFHEFFAWIERCLREGQAKPV